MFKDDFEGFEEGSHNFLLVCRHWFEVASHTPEVWSFWGNTPQEWARWYPRSGLAPLDLVLGGCYSDGYFDTTLSNALRDRASKDAIRRIHLISRSAKLLDNIISSLSPESEGIRSNSVESFIIRNWSHDPKLPVRASDLFAHYRFPKLQHLELSHCTISSWDHLQSRTSTLTNLILEPDNSSPAPSTSQLLSILASNPTLQKIRIFEPAVPNDGDNSSFQVPLHQLKELKLDGNSQHVVRLLHRLDHPRTMDKLHLSLDCAIADISQTVGPYLGDYIRRRGKPQGGLGIFLPGKYPIALCFREVGGIDYSTARSPNDWFLKIEIYPEQPLREQLPANLILDLITHTPQEDLVDFQSEENPVAMGSVYARFPNLRTLSFDDTPLATIFPKSNPGEDEGIPLSLQHISLHRLTVEDGYWSPLTTFLSHHASTGNQLRTLKVFCCPPMHPEVVESVRAAVQEFIITDTSSCPFGVCSYGY